MQSLNQEQLVMLIQWLSEEKNAKYLEVCKATIFCCVGKSLIAAIIIDYFWQLWYRTRTARASGV